MLKTIFQNLLLRVETLINYQNDSEKTLTEELENLKKQKEISQQLAIYFAACIKSETNESEKELTKMPLISQGEEMKFKGKTIFKNKTCNTWYTRYRIDGKQYYISGKTQQEVLKELKSKLNYQTKENQKSKSLLDWYHEWLNLFKVGKVKQTTILDYEKSLKYINTNIKNKNIKNITSIEIVKNLDEIKLERTKQKVYEFLNTLFFKAKQYKIINENIMDIIEKPKHIRERGIALTKKEQEIFIDNCKRNKYADVLLVTLYQGLRIGEVLGITGNDINLEKQKLTINKTINSKNQFDTTKNNQSKRTMPIFNKTFNILKKYADQKDKRIFDFSYNVPQKHLKDVLKISGLNTNISLHDLRHTFITNCKNANIPEHIIQSWIGHQIGSKVTSTIYTHVNEEDTKNYLDLFNKSM